GPTARRDSDRLERAVFFSRMGNHDSVLFNVLETIATFECSRATRHAAHGRASGRMTRSQSQDLEIEYRKDGNARIHVTPASVAGENVLAPRCGDGRETDGMWGGVSVRLAAQQQRRQEAGSGKQVLEGSEGHAAS